MPGILPMKVIKVGTSSQSRIAQACDRCRSKKIRCDGIRPCCSQCANVGFECKTSDKLSRRAFPRGYTESLEERVRSLEAEVRELKDLLDEKDEKIDMLSKMHSNRRASHSSASSAPSLETRAESPPREDLFRVQASPLLLESENSDSFFMGASSARAFVDTVKRKIQESGKSCAGFNTEALLNIQGNPSPGSTKPISGNAPRSPPRLFLDRCVQIFFQEWAPLFPVLHRPTFLRLYGEYVSDPEGVTNDHKLAQLHLVFGIAALSSSLPDRDQIEFCEDQWQTSLNAVLMDNTMSTLQSCVLAVLFCILKGDRQRLQQHYRGVAVGLSHRLGLHQSQKRFSFGALTMETRKKVFWTLYTVDCFSAALLGLPRLLAKDEDIQCEYPNDVDDEYVTEKGFLPTLPGESSKISAALSLFRVSRILSKVLHHNYPASASHELSLQSLLALEAELNDWSDELPPHLKLTFVQDKPSTNVTGNRSALLSLAYYYIRSLIHRPAVGSTLGSKASPSVISLADSSKHIIQIVELLEERSMSFSFCLNKNEMLALCGLSLLFQSLDLKQEGKLMKDGQRLVGTVLRCLERAQAPGAADFRWLASSMMPIDSRPESYHHRMPDGLVATTSAKPTASPRYPSVSNSEKDLPLQQNRHHTMLPAVAMHSVGKHSNRSQSSIDSVRSESPMPRRDYRSSVSQVSASSARSSFNLSPKSRPNLDYLPLNDSPAASQSTPLNHSRSLHSVSSHKSNLPITSTPQIPNSNSNNLKLSSVSPAEWESLLSSLDSGQSNIYDAVYGGPTVGLAASHSHPSQSETLDWTELPFSEPTALSNPPFSAYSDSWSPEPWDMTALSMHDFDAPRSSHLNISTQSVLSVSEDSLSSGDDLAGSDFVSANGGGSGRQSLDYRQALLTGPMGGDGFLLDGLDVGFGL